MKHILFSTGTLLLCCILYSCKPQDQKSLLEPHLSQEAQVFGPYAVVKLPVQTGVPVWNPSQVVLGPDGYVYVANIPGEIYRLMDQNGDGLEDHAALFCDVKADGLKEITSMVWKGSELYVGSANQIRVYRDQDNDGKADDNYVFFEGMPLSEHPYEWTSALTFGPDGWLYLVLTTDSWNPAPSPDPKGWRGSILRISPDGKQVERFATGIRSSHSMVFTPEGELLFTDNAGGGNPTEELNLAVAGGFYGHNKLKFPSDQVQEPIYSLITEVAPSGMEYNSANNSFGGTGGNLFVGFYGPGERWERGAISRLEVTKDAAGNLSFNEIPVIKGLGKISDLAFGSNGDLYVTQVGKTDYWYRSLDQVDGAIYRIIPVDWVKPLPIEAAFAPVQAADIDQLQLGETIFATASCSACHSVDGKSELLGPDLKDIGRYLSKEELIEEIQSPSLRIKPSMFGLKITKTNGEVHIGRVVNANEEKVQLMIVGNKVVNIPRSEIDKEEEQQKSLMYANLLNTLQDNEKEALLAYLLQLYQAE